MDDLSFQSREETHEEDQTFISHRPGSDVHDRWQSHGQRGTAHCAGDLRTLAGWTSVERAAGQGPGGGDCASLAASSEAVFVYPTGTKGWYKRGFRAENDSTADWRDFYGLQFDVKLIDDRPVQLTAQIRLPGQPVRLDYVTPTRSTVAFVSVRREASANYSASNGSTRSCLRIAAARSNKASTASAPRWLNSRALRRRWTIRR